MYSIAKPTTPKYLIRLNSTFSGCSSLESIDFGTFNLPYDFKEGTVFPSDYTDKKYHVYECGSLFNGCSSLTEIKNIDHLIPYWNTGSYRLYTLVVTYEGDSAGNKGKKLDARAYIRYCDANGKIRVFYNDYKKNVYYGGCLCSYNQVQTMAIPVDEPATG